MNIISLKSLRNVRELSYGEIRNNRLIRGQALHRVSKRDLNKLKELYCLNSVIDLRTEQEVNDKKDKLIDGVDYHHIPLIPMEELGIKSEKEGRQNVLKEHKLPDICEYYQKLVAPSRKEAWTKIFDTLLSNEKGATYIHCTVGKDRCGIVSAIILSALDVDINTIKTDYLLTNNDSIIPWTYRVFALSLRDKKFRHEFLEYFTAKEMYLDAALTYIEETYGSIANFLKEICSLDDIKINKLRKLYLK